MKRKEKRNLRINMHILFLTDDRAKLYERIDRRVDSYDGIRFRRGSSFLKRPRRDSTSTAMQGLGIKNCMHI